MFMLVFGDGTPSRPKCPEAGGSSMLPRNAGIYPPVNTTSQDQRRQLVSQGTRQVRQRVAVTVILLVCWSKSRLFSQLCDTKSEDVIEVLTCTVNINDIHRY
jgi:hypothetical protein